MDRSDDLVVSHSCEKWIHRLEVTVDWPPGHAAAYLLDGPEPVLIDAGPPGERAYRELAADLAVHGYDPGDVSHLLLTHPHSDHIGQASAIIDAADPVVYALAGVRSRLERSPTDLAAGVSETAREAGLEGSDVEEAVEDACSSLRRNRRLLPPERIDVDLAGGQRFAGAGFEWEVIHTPGHQVDHASFFRPEAGVLFSGDVLIEPFRAAALDVGLDRGAYDAFSHYYTAYDRLAAHDADRVYPGHGPVFTAYDETLARSRRDLDSRIERVFDAVAENPPASPLDATRAQLSKDPHHKRLRTTLLETVGALGLLERADRVSWEHDEAGVRQYSVDD